VPATAFLKAAVSSAEPCPAAPSARILNDVFIGRKSQISDKTGTDQGEVLRGTTRKKKTQKFAQLETSVFAG
jgi:hypothetical protein